MDQPRQPREYVWTVEELAQHWSVSTATIYGLLEQEMFPGAFKVGRLWRIPDRAVASYLEAQATGRSAKRE